MYKRSELITVISFCLIIAILSVLFVVLPDKEFSEQENRNLEQAPELNNDTFFSGEFAKDTNVYYSDQFPFRNLFVKIKSFSELALLKGENNGVLYSEEQLAVKDFNAYQSIINIVEDTDRIFLDSAEAQLKAIDTLGKNLEIPHSLTK